MVLAIKSLELAAQEISEERIRPTQKSFERNHFVVFVTDIDAEYHDLLDKGVHFVDSPKSLEGGWHTAHFEDPDGNLWEIAQRPGD
jgi:catechol 2,3-dioxygenase-like lactoylglutathione lyase family enzyme